MLCIVLGSTPLGCAMFVANVFCNIGYSYDYTNSALRAYGFILGNRYKRENIYACPKNIW